MKPFLSGVVTQRVQKKNTVSEFLNTLKRIGMRSLNGHGSQILKGSLVNICKSTRA